MLALSLIPLMGFTGAAIDYSRGNATKVAMQAALDSTGLILSKDAQSLSGADTRRPDQRHLQRAVQPAGSAERLDQLRSSARPQQGSFSLKLTGSATVRPALPP